MATYTLINSSVLSSPALSVVFSSIPASYTDLVIKVNARTSEIVNNELLIYRLNGNSGNNYSTTTLIGNASTVASNQPAGASNIRLGWENGASSTSDTFSNAEIYIPNYLANQNKPTGNFSVQENMTNSTAATYINTNAGLSQITDPITSVTILSINELLFVAGSSFYLYGVFRGPETLPSTPTIGTATATGATTATVAFTPTSATGVDASYTALSTPGSITTVGTSSPITVSGLTTGTAYTFQVRANNPGGSSAYSSASNSVTPDTAFDSIATATVGSAGVITFSSIPSTYKHLQLRYMAKCASTTAAYMRFNGDTGTNYNWHFLNGTGSAVGTNGYATQAQIGFTPPDSGIGSSQFTVGIVDILDYQSTTKNKTVRTFCGIDVNGAGGDVALDSGLWRNTNAITSITITTFGTNFSTGSNFALYGIRG